MSNYKLISLFNDPRYTMLVQPDAVLVYTMKTENATTTIRRNVDGDAEKPGVIVGKVVWNQNASDLISIGDGPEIRVDDVLRMHGKSTESRVFTAPGGREYVWTTGSEVLTLKAQDSKESIAAYFLDRPHFFRKDEKACLEIREGSMDMMDHIVVTWVWMAKMWMLQKMSSGFLSNGRQAWSTVGRTA